MKSKLKGGIESIVGLIVIVGIVIALIIAAVLPAADQAADLGQQGTNKLDSLGEAISGNED